MLPLPEGKKYHIFLAHSGKDTETAVELKRLLGESVSVFLDCESLLPGDTWDTEIPKAQQESLITVILISKNIERSFYQQEEVAAAIALSRESEHRVVPVYLSKSGVPIPYGLRRIHSIHLKKEHNLEAIAADLRRLVEKVSGDRKYESLESRKGKGLWRWRRATWMYVALLMGVLASVSVLVAINSFKLRAPRQSGNSSSKSTDRQPLTTGAEEAEGVSDFWEGGYYVSGKKVADLGGASHLIFGESKDSYRIEVMIDARGHGTIYIKEIDLRILRLDHALLGFTGSKYYFEPVAEIDPGVKTFFPSFGSASDKSLRFIAQVSLHGTSMENYRVSADGEVEEGNLRLSFPATFSVGANTVKSIYMEVPKKFRGENVAMLNTAIGRLAWGHAPKEDSKEVLYLGVSLKADTGNYIIFDHI